MQRLQDKNRKYKRWRHSPKEKLHLQNQGLQHVLSSNVSAIGRVDEDLIVRFHNGSLYRYPGSGWMMEDMLNSNSKGEFVWDNLRGRIRGVHKVPYEKIGKVPLPQDLQMTDEEIFADMDKRYIENLTGSITAVIAEEMVFNHKLGVMMDKIDIGGVTVYRPIV